MDEWLQRLRYYFRRHEFEADLEEELQHHRGLSGAEKFGNFAQVQENSRGAWNWLFLEELVRDLNYALRAMKAQRLFSVLAVLSLALGIGANTAIFSFLDTLMLRPLPVRDPDTLASLQWHTAKWPEFTVRGSGVWYRDTGGPTGVNMPFAAYELFKGQEQFFSDVAGYSSSGADVLNLVAGGEARGTAGQRVSGNFFSLLGVEPAAGRLIQPADDGPGAPLVAVISHALWMGRFGGSLQTIGQRVRINNHFVTVIGVTPPGFRGPGFMMFEKGRDLYLPLHTPALADAVLRPAAEDSRFTDPKNYWIEVLARLKPGVRREQVERALEPLFQRLVVQTEGEGKKIALPSLISKPGGRGSAALQLNYGEQVWILFALVTLILGIACANVANLLLARGEARQRELAVRLSVGASRGRVVRQLLTEAVLLSALGGLGGIAVAVWTMRYLTAMLSAGQTNFLLAPDLNWRVLAVCTATSIVTGILFGLVPALRATRVDVFPTLKESRIAGAPRRWRAQSGQVLVAAQMALSVVLLIAAGLFVVTFVKLYRQDLGFDPRNVLLVRTESNIAGYATDAARLPLYDGLRARFAALPGVSSASESEGGLIRGSDNVSRSMAIRVDGKETPKATTFADGVGPGYLSTLGISLLAGREIDERDAAARSRVAVVNQKFAETYFSGQNPLGRRFEYVVGEAKWSYEIIGVVGNVRTHSLKSAVAFFWLPYKADTRKSADMTFAIRTKGDPLRLANAVRRIVRETDERLPLTITTQEQEVEAASREEQIFAVLASGAAGLGLVIACVGLYGTVAFHVARRTNEIGIRMALGAQRRSVMWMVARQVSILVVAGIAVGVPAALAGSKLVASYLYEVKPGDPFVMAGALVAILGSTALAALIPARRASRIDPMVALRHE